MIQWYPHAELDKDGHLEGILCQKKDDQKHFLFVRNWISKGVMLCISPTWDLTQDVFLFPLAFCSRMDIILPPHALPILRGLSNLLQCAQRCTQHYTYVMSHDLPMYNRLCMLCMLD